MALLLKKSCNHLKTSTAMKKVRLSIAVIMASVLIISCSTSKTYFTPQVRTKVEKAGVNLNKIQFYADRNIELRREVTKEESQLSKGKIVIENGKYINIITLKKNTPGVCSGVYPDKVLVSFETGENKFLTFGKTQYATAFDPYKILAFEWFNNGDGMIKYEGNSYRITNGTQAGVMISSRFVRKADEVKQRQMEGVKVAD